MSIPWLRLNFTTGATSSAHRRVSAVLSTIRNHMAELLVEGPDAEKFLSYLAINSFKNFTRGKAKHFVPVTPGRLRHRRRDHVPRERNRVQTCRSRTHPPPNPSELGSSIIPKRATGTSS